MRVSVLSPDSSASGPRLQLGSLGWAFLEQDLNPGGSAGDFICVSYSWGLGRTPNMFYPASPPVSDRTEPALRTVILQRPACRKVWVDAFCVPGPERPTERAATLQSMGFIYSQAEEVIVVLTAGAREALEQVNRGSDLVGTHLDALEQEDWVTRAWTYQEAVNARRLRLACDGASAGTIVDCLEFVSRVGQALNQMSAQGRDRYPRLNSFEDVMVDALVAGYLQRSALQVMCVMDGRTQTWPDDHFYAMIGAISAEPAGPVQHVSPCEAFMSLCERKGDYSFIFSSTPRDSRPGIRWRPADGPDLPAILKLSGTGNGLQGRREKDCLLLEGVVAVKPNPMSSDARAYIARWLATPFSLAQGGVNVAADSDELEQMAFQSLQYMGFSGSFEYMETESGLFFPQVPIPSHSAAAGGTDVVIATGIPWRMGSPALARYPESPDSGTVLYTPGVFFGRIAAAVNPPTTVMLV